MEDNRFDCSGIGDAHAGARYVLRHNTIASTQSKAPQMYNHGLNPSGRSMRAAEVYLNTFVEAYPKGVNQPTYSNNGGTLLYWGNNVSGYTYLVDIDYMRKDNSIYNYGTPPTGWGTCSTTAGTGWDQKGISSGYICMDQPGRGAGDLLSGWFPSLCNQTQGCTSYYGQWPRHQVSPIYIWNNSFTPASGYWPVTITHTLTTVVSENRDYYQQIGTYGATGTFDGSKSIGQGLYSTMPAVCTAGPGGSTPGVGYWATDRDTLYVCTSTNSWSAYYTPFRYPHPLAQSSGTVTPPSSLTAVVQ